VPPRGTTPQPVVNRAGATTPAQCTESFGSSKSVPNKRPRLGNSSVLNAGGGAPTFGYNQPLSYPHKPLSNKTNTPPRPGGGYNVAHGMAKPGPTSSLPRPIPIVKHAHVQQHGNGYLHGPVASYGGGRGSSYAIPRIPSTASVTSNAGYSIFNAIGGGRNGSRRESFKPRPSVDGSTYDTGTSLNGGHVGRQWGGFMGRTVKEEDEY
jgi:Ase1/PRC1/MAP65 family protein